MTQGSKNLPEGKKKNKKKMTAPDQIFKGSLGR